MHNIVLVTTAHDEKGNCNIKELYNIIKKIKPEIIFEEIPPSVFYDFYEDGNRSNLESSAITMYLENYKCEHIPVDLDYIPDKLFFNAYESMHRQIELRSNIYRNIIDKHSFYRGAYGFKYLNSIECVNLDKELNIEIKAVLRILNDKKMYEINKAWNDYMDKRENEMLKNIYRYSDKNEYNKGLLFIGSGHRDTIVDKIDNYPLMGNVVLNWNYSNYENII